ncbi:MAG TPA: arginine repressor [Anaeromyxobacteraceae bacterium]|nr:arginine repressor [Anaeromyxobacteraceae bacterium]
MTSANTRRDAIARIVRSRRVATQDELLRLVRAEGFDVTQATLSRDLARLGARRVSSPEGGTAYELGPADPRESLSALRGLVSAVSSNGALVVVRTQPGLAPAVARAIDLAQLPDVLGTLAGDDTIFIAPAKAGRVRSVASRLAAMFG